MILGGDGLMIDDGRTLLSKWYPRAAADAAAAAAFSSPAGGCCCLYRPTKCSKAPMASAQYSSHLAASALDGREAMHACVGIMRAAKRDLSRSIDGHQRDARETIFERLYQGPAPACPRCARSSSPSAPRTPPPARRTASCAALLYRTWEERVGVVWGQGISKRNGHTSRVPRSPTHRGTPGG